MTAITTGAQDHAAALVARAVSGDEAAFAEIVAAHHADLRRVAFMITGEARLADEAVAAAWVRAWRRLGSLRDPARLRPWLVAVAANEARRLARRAQRRSVREIAPDERIPGGADPAERVGDLDLAAALARLSPDDRALLSLRYVAGFDATELARATGRSPSGTRVRLMRLLGRLRKELHDD